MAGTVHVVGAGLAGLAASVSLAAAGRRVTLYEAGPAAGGRCRSYFDRGLGMRIDNGNHLVLSGNRATHAYLQQVGAQGLLTGPSAPLFPFADVSCGARWVVAPNKGRVPWWVLSRGRRVPGTRVRDYLALLALRRAGATQTVQDVLGGGVLYRRLLEPLAIAALNTPTNEGLATLLDAVVRESLMQGGAACLPRVPRVGLSETFVDPALAWLSAHGATAHTGRRVAAVRRNETQATALEMSDGLVALGAEDSVVLAVPAWVAADLLPELRVPDAFSAILNVHFAVHADPGRAGFWGVVGGTAEWIFVRPNIVSVTVSAANRLVDLSADEIAAHVWPDVRAVLRLPDKMPPVRVVKERRATHVASAAQEARRPGARTSWQNLVLAGDWTATGLPATIEGAIRSGRTAAAILLAS
jgi:squalene-associated FAD-dependent desaturase